MEEFPNRNMVIRTSEMNKMKGQQNMRSVTLKINPTRTRRGPELSNKSSACIRVPNCAPLEGTWRCSTRSLYFT